MATSKTEKIRVSSIRISNILGIDELEFSPAGFTEVSGRNGQGKTSLLEAIKSVVKGGHDATLLRKGAEVGEVVMVLDNGMTITERVTPHKTDRAVERDGMKASSPAQTIKALADMLSVNPIDFLRAAKKDRVSVLLEAMPMTADGERLNQITGTDTSSWLSDDIHALDAIAQVHKQIYDERTGVNREAKGKQSTIDQLTSTLPEDDEDIDSEGLAALRLQVQEVDARKEQEMGRINTKLDGLRAESQTRLDELQRQMDAERAGFAETERKAAAQRQKASEKFHVERQEIAARLSAAEAMQSQSDRNEQTRTTITTMQADVDALVAESEAKTAAIDALEKYKTELLSKLPIPGLEVVDGEILRNGVQFDRLNTAQQVEVAVEVAKLRAGKLGLICVDGIELLDSDAYQEFKMQALASGLQMVVARVTNDDLKVTTS